MSVPFDLPVQKNILNQNEYKQLKLQRFLHSSFMNGSKDVNNNHEFFLNKERITQDLDLHSFKIKPIKNDWQDPKIIPTL